MPINLYRQTNNKVANQPNQSYTPLTGRKETMPHGCNPSREEERQWTGGEGIHSVEWEGEGILAEAKLLPWSDTPDCRGSKNI